ncbi:MAG TPA: S41 family peptidase [Saprospiraceae bacterium]|nr:S41 family peptidase [Saprospiraceae bacterium]HMQ82295.1 S41 family peptidase [Saprospiraceae bacterium]
MYKRLLILGLLASFLIELHGQWQVTTVKSRNEVVCDLMDLFMHGQYATGYHFWGLPQAPADSVRQKGVALKALRDGWDGVPIQDTASISLLLDKSIAPTAFINLDMARFHINAYLKNVDSYSVFLKIGEDRWLKKEIQQVSDGYQIPGIYDLKKWELLGIGPSMNSLLNEAVMISRLLIIAKKRPLANSDIQFVLSECYIYEQTSEMVPAKGAFFYELTNDTINFQNSAFLNVFGNAYPVKQAASFRGFSPSNAYYFSVADSSISDTNAVFDILKYIIARYPYYDELKISRKEVNRHLDDLLESSSAFEEKLEQIRSLIHAFGDGHFFVYHEKENLKASPVLAKEIQGNVVIAAVFDPALLGKITPGMQVIAVDSRPVEVGIEALMPQQQGSLGTRRSLAVSKLFHRRTGDSIRVTLLDGEQTLQVNFSNQVKFKPPANFIPAHGKFTVTPDNWGIFRLNHWELGDWIRFVNLYEDLKNLDGIIFDLRSNPGGAEIEALRVLSTFIKDTIVVSEDQYNWLDGHVERYENIIYPNPYYCLQQLSVMILIDEKTACASELFCSNMRRYANAQIIGSENTAGAFASGSDFYLPMNIKVRSNGLSRLLSLDEDIDTGRGLKPDVRVEINGFQDLFPYEDKVLKTALSLTSSR